jgi:deoxyadenosine/deoxycytidine kinase
MGKLVTIIGSAGCGKTTLTRLLCQSPRYMAFLEQHHERPFQQTFMQDLKTGAFANQVDFMLFRSEQEADIRARDIIGIQDGGLDQDFHIFTRLFYQNGYLTENEFDLCRRFFHLARRTLPPPDCTIRLLAPPTLLAERRSRRSREIDIAQNADIPKIERLLQEWLSSPACQSPILEIDTQDNDLTYSNSIDKIRRFIETSCNSL